MNRTIFIADDDPHLLNRYRSLLLGSEDLDFFGGAEGAGAGCFDVQMFCDGQALIDRFRECSAEGKLVALCILDVRMPRMNGLAAADELRKIAPDVLLVFVTAFSDFSPADMRRRLSENMFFLHKPFNEEEFLSLTTSLVTLWNQQDYVRKSKEAAFQRQSFLENLFDAMPEPVFYKDAGGRLLGCNRAYLGLMGLPAEEVVGKTVEDLVPLEHAKLHILRDAELFATGSAQVYECDLLVPSGETMNLQFHKAPFHRSDGAVAGEVCVIQDLTGHRRALVEMRHAKDRAELFNMVVPSAVFTVDTERRVTSWNRRAAEITGYSAQEVVGQACHLFGGPFSQLKCGSSPDGASGHVVNRESVIKTKAGEVRHVLENSGEIRDPEGNVVGGIESFEDITELKKIEEKLRGALADMERMNHLMEGREVRVMELKRQVNDLLEEMGRPPRFRST